MSKQQIRRLIENRLDEDGLVGSGVKGVQLFRVTEPVRCAPAVYEPTLVAIVSGTKEAILDGTSHVYDTNRYLCCAISLPVEAGTPMASPNDPLLGVQTTLDPRLMTELAIEMENAAGAIREPRGGPPPKGSPSPAGTTHSPTPWSGSCNSPTIRPTPQYSATIGYASSTTPSSKATQEPPRNAPSESATKSPE